MTSCITSVLSEPELRAQRGDFSTMICFCGLAPVRNRPSGEPQIALIRRGDENPNRRAQLELKIVLNQRKLFPQNFGDGTGVQRIFRLVVDIELL